jgi:cation:H+ antiporter
VDVILVVIGVIALYFGGELLVRHASSLAAALGISPMVVGLTVVAFGTSAPELAATLVAAWRGAPELAVANVIGSNVANIGLILGLTALAYPLVSNASFVRREVPWMLLASVLAVPLLADGRIGRPEGFLLWAALALFLVAAFRTRSVEEAVDLNVAVGAGGGPAVAAPGDPAATAAGASPAGSVPDGPAQRPGTIGRSVVWIAVGIAALALGAQALVDGATGLALALGVPQRVIGLTLVAVGTSLPELASSLVAALRRETDIILGNVIGSNLFNLLAVLGTAAVVHPIAVEAATVRIDLLVMLAFAVVVVPLLLWGGHRIGRRGGIVLVVGYGAYIAWLFV